MPVKKITRVCFSQTFSLGVMVLCLAACGKHSTRSGAAASPETTSERNTRETGDLATGQDPVISLDTIPDEAERAQSLYTLAVNRFISLDAEDPRIPQLLLERADSFFQENKLEEAISFYEKIIRDYRDSREAALASEKMVQAYGLLGEKRSTPQVDPHGKKHEAKRGKEAAQKFLEAQDLRKQNDYMDAAMKFYQVYQQYPDLEIGGKALFESGLDYKTLEDWNGAIRTFQSFQEAYYDSPLMPEAIFHEAQCWESLRAYDRATKKYLNVVRNFPNARVAENSLLKVASNFERTGQLELSLRVVERYREIYPNSAKLCEFFQNGTGLGKYEQLGDAFQKINNHYQKTCQ